MRRAKGEQQMHFLLVFSQVRQRRSRDHAPERVRQEADFAYWIRTALNEVLHFLGQTLPHLADV